MSETFRPRDEFERVDLGSLIRKISDLVDVLGKIAPADMISRPSSQASPQDASAVVEGEEESKPKRRSRKREAPESPASPYDLAKLLGVNLGGPRGQRGEYLSPSSPSSFVVSPSGAGPRDPGSFDNPIDVTPKLNAPPSPAGLPAPSSNLPAPIGPSAVDHALTPGRLDRIAVDFVDSVLDAIDIKQRMSAAAFSGNGGRNSGGGWGPGGPGGPNGPWGPFQATNYRTSAGGGASGGGSGGGGGSGSGGAASGGNWKKNPFGGGAWNWFRRSNRANASASKSFRRGGAWSWSKHAGRAWSAWSGPRYKAAARGAFRAARFSGFSVGASGAVSRAAGAAGLVAVAVKGIYDAAQALKQSSERQFQTGRRLAAYNGSLAATFAGVDIAEGFRNRQLAEGTAGTYRTLAGVVNMNRQSQVGIDTFTTNLGNRAAIAGGAAASGILYIAGEFSKTLDSFFNRMDPGGKGLESAMNGMWRNVLWSIDKARGFKEGDPNSWLAGFDKQQKDAQKLGNLFEFTDFIKEAKDMKPLRANLQLKL